MSSSSLNPVEGLGWASHVTVGDYNLDGRSDYAGQFATNAFFQVVLTSSSGGFLPPVSYTFGSQISDIKTADMNDDSWPDLVIIEKNTDQLTVLLNTGNGAFSTFTTVLTGSSPKSLFLHDFNADSYTDVAVANYSASTVSIHFGDGTGTLLNSMQYIVCSQPEFVTGGNFNSDNQVDLAVTNGNITSILKNSSGTFSTVATLSTGFSGYVFGQISPSPMQTIDWNDDGKTDLAGINNSQLKVLQRTGDFTFSSPITYSSLIDNRAIYKGDINSDGRTDLITSGPLAIRVFPNSGTGAFAATVSYSVGSNMTPIFGVGVADFNLDLKSDLIVCFDNTTNNILLENCNKVMLSVKEDKERVIVVFPNPTTERLIIRSNERQGAIKVEIHGVNGELFQCKVNFKPNNEIEVDTSLLKEGVYLIQLLDDQAVFAATRFAVLR